MRPEPERWVVIPRWEEFQHYRDRAPVWVKNYTRLLHDPAYLGLTLHQRGVLHGLWMEYATSGREIPDSTATITRRLGERVTRATLDALSQAGFIAFSDSRPIAGRYHGASLEKEGEKEKELKGFSTRERPEGQPQPLTTRAAARAVRCPTCRAEPGEPCTGARDKLRESCHAERHVEAIRLGARPLPLGPAQGQAQPQPRINGTRLLHRQAATWLANVGAREVPAHSLKRVLREEFPGLSAEELHELEATAAELRVEEDIIF